MKTTNKVSHTPGPFLAIFENKYENNLAEDITVRVIDSIEEHSRIVAEATADHLEFIYIPVSYAKAAPELLEALETLISGVTLETIAEVRKDNDLPMDYLVINGMNMQSVFNALQAIKKAKPE